MNRDIVQQERHLKGYNATECGVAESGPAGVGTRDPRVTPNVTPQRDRNVAENGRGEIAGCTTLRCRGTLLPSPNAPGANRTRSLLSHPLDSGANGARPARPRTSSGGHIIVT